MDERGELPASPAVGTLRDPVEAVPTPPGVPGTDPVARGADGHGAGPAFGARRTLAALLIAFISVVAALTTWRAEVAGAQAALANRNGTVVALEASGATVTAQADARAEERRLSHFQELTAAADELAAQGQAATTPEAKAALADQVAIARRVAEANAHTFPGTYVVAARDGGVDTFDVERRVTDLLRERRVETDSRQEFALADTLQQERRTLVRLDILLVGALALATLAQLLRRRLASVVLLLLGFAAFLTASALFAVTEL